MNIYKIVIDGGPCGGKTSGLSRITKDLEEKGIITLCTPEVPSILIQSGVTPDLTGKIEFQELVIKEQLQNENFWTSLAEIMGKKFNKDVVVLCDRALLSPIAYIGVENNIKDFENFTKKHLNLDIETIRGRYDAVLHMATAAIGAEEFYTLENNAARSETLEEARILDERTMNVWLGHKCLRVIPNTKKGKKITFQEKLDMLMSEIYSVIGHPVPIEIEDKYLLKSFNPEKVGEYVVIGITQKYLVNPITEERIRKRSWLGGETYFHTIKKPIPRSSERIEIERKINSSDYHDLLLRQDPSMSSIEKKRYCFLYENQYFEVDVFGGNHEGLIICEREKTSSNESTHLPDFLDVEKEVTHDPNFKNYNLAKK